MKDLFSPPTKREIKAREKAQQGKIDVLRAKWLKLYGYPAERSGPQESVTKFKIWYAKLSFEMKELYHSLIDPRGNIRMGSSKRRKRKHNGKFYRSNY